MTYNVSGWTLNLAQSGLDGFLAQIAYDTWNFLSTLSDRQL